jgi:hypothetical protein
MPARPSDKDKMKVKRLRWWVVKPWDRDGGILFSSTYEYSWLPALDEVSGQRHAPAAHYPREKTLGTHRRRRWVGLRAGLDTEATGNPFTSAGDRTPVVQSVVKHYTDWATPAHNFWLSGYLTKPYQPLSMIWGFQMRIGDLLKEIWKKYFIRSWYSN